MSCMLVDNKCIDVLLSVWYNKTFYFHRKQYVGSVTDLTELGKILKDENIRSFTDRYEGRYQDEVEPEYKFTYRKSSPLEVFDMLRYYEYQSCECEDWEQSVAYSLCNIIIRKATYMLEDYLKERRN